MHGMENAVDDDDDDEIEQQLSSMMKGRRRVVEGHTFGGSGAGSGVVGDKLEKVVIRLLVLLISFYSYYICRY